MQGPIIWTVIVPVGGVIVAEGRFSFKLTNHGPNSIVINDAHKVLANNTFVVRIDQSMVLKAIGENSTVEITVLGTFP